MKTFLISQVHFAAKYGVIACFLPVLFFSCIHHQQPETSGSIITPDDSVKVNYAQGFEVNYRSGYIELIVHSIEANSFFADTLFLKTDSLNANPGLHYTGTDLKSVVCQSSTQIAFLDVLGELDRVTGLCGLDYVQDPFIRKRLLENGVHEICQADQVSTEAVQKLDPDLFLIYPFETSGKTHYSAQGIPTFYIAEYLETSALARLEWIKLFGLLLDKTEEANAYFEDAEAVYRQYEKTQTDSSKTFFLNLPFKDSWYMPSANSLIVNLIEDAGLCYYYQETGSTENDVHASEEVWNDAVYAEYWIIMAHRPADFSMKDLLAEEPVYRTFKATAKNQVIFCNTATSNYFSRGIVEPHVMLKDILYATGQLQSHEPQYFFLLK